MAGTTASKTPLFRRALVVDDEGGLQLLVRAILEHSAYLVDVARDGLEACNRVRGVKYDAIICDILMPNMDGTTFFHTLLEIDAQQARRVLFVTGEDLDDETKAKLRTSGRPLMHKPFEIDEFQRVVDGVAAGTAE